MCKINEGIGFPDFISGLRKKQKLTMKQLCKGVCSTDTIASLEKRAIAAEKAVAKGAVREELSFLFTEALTLTAPTACHVPLACLVLSAKELNLLLEAEHYRLEGERPEQYKEVLDYLEQKQANRCNLAKIYPKAVYYLCRAVLTKGEHKINPDVLLKYCDQAVEILQNKGKIYFLWEILELRERLAEIAAQNFIIQGLRENVDNLRFPDQKNKVQKQLADHKVTKEIFEYCYLYIENKVSCLNDVICMRRKMLGMSRRELAEGICDKKTLERLEHKRVKTHLAIVQELLCRLDNAQQKELVAPNLQTKELMADVE